MIESEQQIQIETSRPTLTLLDLETHGSTPVDSEWFSAYQSGNLLWPQVALGMHIKLFDAIMRRPPEDAQSFLSAQLSEEQQQDEIKTMLAVHAAKNIHPTVWRFAQGYSARINKLWRWAKLSVGNEIVKFQTGVTNEVLNESTDITSAITYPLNKFFTESIHSAQGERIKRMSSDAVVALESPQGKALAAIHRYSFDRRDSTRVVPEMKRYCQQHGVKFMGLGYDYAPLGKQYVQDQMRKYPQDMQRLLNIYP